MASFLFPQPTYLPSTLSPIPHPGVTPESTTTLLQLLEKNHVKWHCFTNTERGFHNHTAHGILAKYWLGAKPDILQKAYEHDEASQQANYTSPQELNEETLYEHLGQADYYDAYFKFFVSKIEQLGIQATLEQFVFARKANFTSSTLEPQVLGRLLGGLLHPLIHAGYGVEFGLPGILAEGLAQAHVHSPVSRDFTSPSLWDGAPTAAEHLSAFTILSRVLKDARWDSIKPARGDAFRAFVQEHSKAVAEYSDMWEIDLSKEGEVAKKLEELSFLVVFIYAVAGFGKAQELSGFAADFFLTHLVTSSLFLPSLTHGQTAASQELLLRTYFTHVLAWYIARGRPRPDIKRFYATTSKHLSSSSSPNEWHQILSSAITDPDEHLCKTQRALAHYASIFGSRGRVINEGNGVEGEELIDGTLFLRAALVTEERRKKSTGFGNDEMHWGFDGFYELGRL